jgi:hypothetical protein
MPTTTPVRTPVTPVVPETSPIEDPSRWYQPERLCPQQTQEAGRRSRPS